MAKVIINGSPLIIDGAPALSTDCCCDDPPPPCPNCCIEIDWGTFDGNGDLYQDLTTIIVTVIMPTKNSRLVCADEEITVVIDIPDPLDPPTGTPYIRWDRHWKYVGPPSPAVGTDGRVFEDGLVEWGTTDPIAEEYSVTLKFDACWSDNSIQYGDIEAGMRGGDFALITGVNCNSAECCEPVFPCDDCCYFIETFDNTAVSYELDDAGNPVFWAENSAGDRIKVTIEGTNSGVYCLGDILTIRVELVPYEYTGDDWYPETYITADGGWQHLSNDPAIGNGSITTGPVPPMSIEWGDNVDGFEFTSEIEVKCPQLPDKLSVGILNKYPTGAGAAAVEVYFTCCSEHASEYSCEDCYPPPDTGFIHCRIDLAGSDGVVVLPIVLADHPGSATEPAGLTDWELIAAWENYCCVENEPENSGIRWLHLIFKCCSFDETNCNDADAKIAVAQYVFDEFGLPGTSVDCEQTVPSDTVSVQDLIDVSVGEAASAGDDGYLEVYEQNNDIDCPPCPPEVP